MQIISQVQRGNAFFFCLKNAFVLPIGFGMPCCNILLSLSDLDMSHWNYQANALLGSSFFSDSLAPFLTETWCLSTLC